MSLLGSLDVYISHFNANPFCTWAIFTRCKLALMISAKTMFCLLWGPWLIFFQFFFQNSKKIDKMHQKIAKSQFRKKCHIIHFHSKYQIHIIIPFLYSFCIGISLLETFCWMIGSLASCVISAFQGMLQWRNSMSQSHR